MDTQLGGKAKKNACMYFVMGRREGKGESSLFCHETLLYKPNKCFVTGMSVWDILFPHKLWITS